MTNKDSEEGQMFTGDRDSVLVIILNEDTEPEDFQN